MLLRYQSSEKIEAMLHTLVDSFDIKQGWIDRPAKGHFILAKIVQNKLRCEYTSVFPYQVYLFKEYDALALQVLDLDGNVREDAKVRLGWQRIRIDKESKNYRIENDWVRRENQRATVELEGFRSVFKIQKHEVPYWHQNNYNQSGPTFYSYMITDKNKYKPNEQLRLKSYALSQSRSPLRKELEIWLRINHKFRKIGSIKPHRPGSYAGEFYLHDSLNLVLDKDYTLQLRENKGRIVADCNFRYEDYELFGNKLEIKLTNRQHYHPETNQLSISASDANGLMLKDARADILVKTRTIQESFQPVVILSDTLIFSQVELKTDGPTLFDIPSDIFQKSNTAYQVIVTVLNSQNERMQNTIDAVHYYSQYDLTARFSNDSICFDLLKNGKPMKDISMVLKYDNEIVGKPVQMPYKEELNPAISVFHFKNELISKYITMSNLSHILKLTGGIEQDSFKIQLHNPQHLEVSWYIYQGSYLLQKGFGDTLDYKSKIENRSLTYYVEFFYSLGGQEHHKQRQYVFREDFLDVSLDIPDRIYPGQQVDATITVKDQLGKPVKGVDLTAMAVTGKLNYHLPDLPYYGPNSQARTKREHYTKRDLNSYSNTLQLDFQRWVKHTHLDTMMYYKFTYPGEEYFKYEYDIADSTQFAIYTMRDGLAQQIFVIEVDKRPVYYSWTEKPKEYSFYVDPDKKHEISLRLYDTVLVIDSLYFEVGKKTILSFDLDHMPKDIIAHKLEPEFTTIEINRHRSYLARFLNLNSKYTYLESDKEFVALHGDQKSTYSYKASVLAGPITPGMKTYTQGEQIKASYRHNGGFSYTVEDNIVYKQDDKDLLPKYLWKKSFNPMLNINDQAMNKERFLENYRKSQLDDFIWQPGIIDVINRDSRIKIILPVEKDSSGIATLLFENCFTKDLILPCKNNPYNNMSRFDSLPQGLNNAVVLFNNSSYLRIDSIRMEPYTHVLMNMNYVNKKSADSVSQNWMHKYIWSSPLCYESEIEEEVRPVRTNPYIYQNTTGNLTGYVYDNDEPLPGVNIIIKGTNQGTITNIDGRFALQIDNDMTEIVISYIGYLTEEVMVSRGSEVIVRLTPEIMALDEIVVIGYGVCKKSDLTGSVCSISGQLAGVLVNQAEELEPEPDQADELTKEAEQKLYQELLTLNSIRSNFSDVGFWEPRLYTNKKGMSQFSITFPDDITQWNALVYAMNKRLQTGTDRKYIKSYKPLLAELHVPRFLTKGDSAFFLGKVLNYTSDSMIWGSVEWTSANTDFEKQIAFSNFHTDKLPVFASTIDSITSRYVFTREDGYLDGEERTIPVIEQGIIRADGTLSLLQNQESIHVIASENETVNVEIMNSQLQIYSQQVNYLLNYRYACNEQLASKLIGLINYKLLMQYEGKAFRYNDDVNKIIKRLLKNQNREFLWSWWDVSDNTSYWMSAHILRALKCAKDAGFSVDLNINNVVSKATYKFDFLQKYSINDADLLHSLTEWAAEIDYLKYISILDSMIVAKEFPDSSDFNKYPSRYSYLKEKLLLQEIRQIRGLQYEQDTLLKYKKEGILGETYFSDGKINRHWYNNSLAANVIAYRIVKKDSLLKQFIVPMQMYFISSRNNGDWNTYQSSGILMNVLPDLLAEGLSKNNSAIVTLSGKQNRTISDFPYKIILQAEEELDVYKESGLPLYFMQYTNEHVTEAKIGVEGFQIKTSFSNNKALKSGVPVDLIVDVTVEKDAASEYVMIEVPIPGACSYAKKQQSYSGVETHREYHKERTVIFCEKMKAGNYRFIIHLLPRFTGKYILNPAQVSLMYIPVVNANTGIKLIEVNDVEQMETK